MTCIKMHKDLTLSNMLIDMQFFLLASFWVLGFLLHAVWTCPFHLNSEALDEGMRRYDRCLKNTATAAHLSRGVRTGASLVRAGTSHMV